MHSWHITPKRVWRVPCSRGSVNSARTDKETLPQLPPHPTLFIIIITSSSNNNNSKKRFRPFSTVIAFFEENSEANPSPISLSAVLVFFVVVFWLFSPSCKDNRKVFSRENWCNSRVPLSSTGAPQDQKTCEISYSPTARSRFVKTLWDELFYLSPFLF